MEIRGFITNMMAYNQGELLGEWITFPIDEDELNEVLERIGSPEEYFFSDWEAPEELDLGEYENIGKINELAGTLDTMDENERNTFFALVENGEEIADALVDVDDWMLIPEIEDDYDLGKYFAREYYCWEIERLGGLADYIDYASYGRDISIEGIGAHTSYGWLEYVG